MESNIKEDKLKLLMYLHEDGAGHGRRFGLDADEVAKDLGWSGEQLCKAASYLAEWGLARLRR